MVREIKGRNLLDRVKTFASTPFFIPVLFLLFLVITIPVITLVTSNRVDIRQRAASQGLTATINIAPGTGNVSPNQQFTADLVIDGGGQAFNAAQADVAISGNVTIQSVNLVPASSGGCNMTFANQASTPSTSNLSFAGAILNGSSTKCTLYTVTLTAGSSGTGGIAISNSQVKAYEDNSEIFLSSQNGLFTISTGTIPPIPQSVIYLSPAQSNIQNGQSFPVQVRVNTNGQTVNAVEAQLSYPASLVGVVSIDDSSSDFNVPVLETSSNGTIHIAYGSITPRSGDILVTTINFKANAAGVAPVDFTSTQIISSVSNTDVFKSSSNGVYTISGGVTPQPTSVPTATPQPTSGPTTTPQPTSVPTATPQPTNQPTSTPVPTATTNPSPTPTSAVSISLTVNNVPGATYKTSYTLSGSKSTNASSVVINNSSNGITYPSSTSWQSVVNLALGNNTFAIFAQDTSGNKSNTATLSIGRHRIGDITGDDVIDLTDLSIFGSDWAKNSNLNNALSDMNADGVINLTDFSILAKAYGN